MSNQMPHEEINQSHPGFYNTKKKTVFRTATICMAAAGLALAIGGFAAGMQYQKSKMKTTWQFTGVGQNQSAGRNFGTRRAGGLGTVTAVSATSITISPRSFSANGNDASAAKTYTIMSSTIITDDGSTVTASDIQIGDTVLIRTGSITGTTAKTIEVNPATGGGIAAPNTESSYPNDNGSTPGDTSSI